LLGYDVVQYHVIPSYRDGGVAVSGSPGFAYNFQGYQFWFSTKENRDLFRNDPWKYAPAFGGFCAWGVAKERSRGWPWSPKHLGPPASPWEGWAIVDGVLIFNIWSRFTDQFLEEADLNMKSAAQRWKHWFGNKKTLEAGPFNTHCIGHGKLENWCIGPQPNPWLEELPQCGINGTGGGIVSPFDEFHQFANDKRSPYRQKVMIGLSVAIPLVFVLALYFVWRKRSTDITTAEQRDVQSDKLEKHDLGTDVDAEQPGGSMSSTSD